jgi:uncharacterized protein (UPF0210 family)
MKIRSITCFFDPTAIHANQTFTQFGELINAARVVFPNAGYAVQTCRISTIPFTLMINAGNVRTVINLAKKLEKQAIQAGFDFLSLGPALIEAPESYAMLPALLKETSKTFFSGVIADKPNGISLTAIRACAQIVTQAAHFEADGFANLRFSALAYMPPFGPFFPGSFHSKGQPPSIAIAVEGADEVVESFTTAGSLLQARENLILRLEEHANQMATILSELLIETRIVFQGFDFSVAPFPVDSCSLGNALELLGPGKLGKHGSLAAAAFLADTLDRGNWPRTGFNGLMLPLLEDSILAERSIDQTLSIKDLLMFSAVCGTGLDTIPLPGNTSSQELEALLLDIAALASRLRKPLTVRAMPVPGKQAGDLTSFDFEYFANGRILELDSMPLQNLFATDQKSFSLRPRNQKPSDYTF